MPPPPPSRRSPEEVAVAYHERTKHHPNRYAAAPGWMDWDTQPDPFRRHLGAPWVALPHPEEEPDLRFSSLDRQDGLAPAALDVTSLSRFLRRSLALTAWKEVQGTRWSLRANPSSGNLHPTEGWLILPPVPGLAHTPALHHYTPREHGLERRAEIDPDAWARWVAPLPPGSFGVALSSIPWREAWKYGERAFRYCQHDVGHALGALRYAAASLGWRLRLLPPGPDSVLAALLGLDREDDRGDAELEHPDGFAFVTPGAAPEDAAPRIEALGPVGAVFRGWAGRPNRLSSNHEMDWDVIEVVGEGTSGGTHDLRADRDGLVSADVGRAVAPAVDSADRVILGRRSAVRMDGITALPISSFFSMLARTLPTEGGTAVPWDSLPWRPRVQLAVFVHRVTGLAPGLYLLLRDPACAPALRAAMVGRGEWEAVSGAPPWLPLFHVATDDLRAQAASVSCGQDIASDGAFSLGMIAPLADTLLDHGAGAYRQLFWEAGLIGQVLYLEAEAAGVRATGIGCYFDDAVHHLLGLRTRDWQSFYHFAVGTPVEDTRLLTLPAYGPGAPVDLPRPELRALPIVGAQTPRVPTIAPEPPAARKRGIRRILRMARRWLR